MARIRSIKPEAFTSESLSRVDYFTRWTFAGLWTYLDDEGYGRGDSRLIRAALYPLDDDVTAKKVDKAIDALIAEGCICCYEVGERQFIHAPKWGDHQKVNRPTKTKFPRCPQHDSGTTGAVVVSIHGGLSESSVNREHTASSQDYYGGEIPRNDAEKSTHGGLSESSVSRHGGLTGGTGNREQGTGNREPSSADADGEPDPFDEFWKNYPRKVSKPEARKAYAKALKATDADTILNGLMKHIPEWSRTELRFVPHAATWLNGERWADVREAQTDAAADGQSLYGRIGERSW